MPAVPSSLIKHLAGKPPGQVIEGVAAGGLLEALEQLPDPRGRFGRRYPLVCIVALAVCAIACNADGFTAIHQWACDLSEDQLARLGGGKRHRHTGRVLVPAEKTIRSLICRIDPAVLLEVVGRYATHRLEQAGMPKVPAHVAKEREARRRAKARAARATRRLRGIAGDGKTLKGSGKDRYERAHLLAIIEHDGRHVIARIKVDGKTNEVPALRDHLAGRDLDGAVLSVDALHTCVESAQAIVDAGGHYLMCVKHNTPALHAKLVAALVTDEDFTDSSISWRQIGHGRDERRYLRVAPAPEDLDFPAAAQVTLTIRRRAARVRGTVSYSKEYVFAITDLTVQQAGPADLALAQQDHWSSESRHHVLDVTFHEDYCRARTGHAAENLSTLRDLAIDTYAWEGHANNAHARRHYTNDKERILAVHNV